MTNFSLKIKQKIEIPTKLRENTGINHDTYNINKDNTFPKVQTVHVVYFMHWIIFFS